MPVHEGLAVLCLYGVRETAAEQAVPYYGSIAAGLATALMSDTVYLSRAPQHCTHNY